MHKSPLSMISNSQDAIEGKDFLNNCTRNDISVLFRNQVILVQKTRKKAVGSFVRGTSRITVCRFAVDSQVGNTLCDERRLSNQPPGPLVK